MVVPSIRTQDVLFGDPWSEVVGGDQAQPAHHLNVYIVRRPGWRVLPPPYAKPSPARPRPSEPPEILRMVVRAKNRRAALTQICPDWETSRPFTGYDLHALAETGELVPVPFADA